MSTRGFTMLAILLSLTLPVWAGSSYTLTELPTSDLGDFVPVAINKHGVVVGAIWGIFGGFVEPRAARWTPQGGLELLDPDLRSFVSDINDKGAIVGAWAGCETVEALLGPLVWTGPDGFRCLPGLEGSATGVNAINNRGEMVGGAFPAESPWPPDPALPNGPVSWASPTSPPQLLMQVLNGYAEDINQRGVAAGWFLCLPEGPCEDGNDFTVNPPAEPTIFRVLMDEPRRPYSR